ncbi:hypothetical protein [Kutzneria chonburiensis]|uniref:Uncharacterized protein n=1 Tax=Kutzneria chonburiensis TaxID=1483604 RepID=A0ABV6N9A5_9PSEU|nr:hypothetical protein [Kutzneria chonburiensis]
MAVGGEQRREGRRSLVEANFSAADIELALELLPLADMAWHDCYGPSVLEMPTPVLDDVRLLAAGDLARLIRFGRTAVRDVRIAADNERATAP